MYYKYLYDDEKAKYEALGLYHLMDEMLLAHSKIKFVHMFCYPGDRKGVTPTDGRSIEYLFKIGTNIRPELMYLSRLEDFPKDNVIDTRLCHMAPRMHTVLCDTLYDAIKIIKMEVSSI